MVKQPSSSLCVPRWATPRRVERETLGPAVAAVCAELGQPLMPWQQQVADVGLELLPDGRPAYRAVRFTVPRQSGKTHLILGWEVQRALGWAQRLGAPQRIVYSAQTGKDAREKLLEDQVPLLTPRRKKFGIQKVTRTNGSEAVVWKNGSRLVLLASGADSGHGKTVDMAVKDELFADDDLRRDQALNPAMATKPFAQELTASTMGTDASVALNAEVKSGRDAVEADSDRGIAYFEWSADPDADPQDPATWWRCMPALGRTISLEIVEHAWQTLEFDEFRRAYLNIPTASGVTVFPPSSWAAVCDSDVEATGEVFAFDVNPERSAAGIVAVGPGPVVEVVDFHPGTGWLVARLKELAGKYPSARFALDRNGPGGPFIDELERASVPLVPLDAAEVVRATGKFYDLVVDAEVKVRTNPDLDVAVAGAQKRLVGDSFAWGRKSSAADISLLMAATVGVWVQQQPPEELVPWSARA